MAGVGQLRAIPAPEGPARSDPAANPAAIGCRAPKAVIVEPRLNLAGFYGRILPFEARAAARYPDIVLARRQAGDLIEKFDALIAAAALAAGASIATRDVGGFAGCGLTVIDPWTAS
jgi:toxin FitB